MIVVIRNSYTQVDIQGLNADYNFTIFFPLELWLVDEEVFT